MATTKKAPRFVGLGNAVTTTLLRAGVKIAGYGHPMYLLTIRGRKTGQPRTTPVVTLDREGKRYLGSPYGMVNWVRNLQAAGEATITRGRRSEAVTARELALDEAALVLYDVLRDGNPFARTYGITPHSSLEDCRRVATGHPLFELVRK